MLNGIGAAAPLTVEEFEELPLETWRDVAGSKLRAGAMLQAGAQLIGLVARSWASRSAHRRAAAKPIGAARVERADDTKDSQLSET